MVGHDAVDAEIEEAVDLGFVVDRPHMHWQMLPMRVPDEALVDEGHVEQAVLVPSGDRHLGDPRAGTPHAPEDSQRRDLRWAETRQETGPTEFAEPGQAAVAERSDAHPLDRRS